MFNNSFNMVVVMGVGYQTAIHLKKIRDVFVLLATSTTIVLVGCGTTPVAPGLSQSGLAPKDADQLLIVDCLLPGQLRRLGRSMTFLTPRRPVKVPTSECEIRGGEYVAFDRANFATALKIWLPQAEKGDPDAQTYVGEIYEKGLGLQADPVVAAQWYLKAADQGHSRARINLGYLYESGLGVEKDLVKAMNYYRAASGFDENNLEYVTAFEVAARKQQTVDLRRQEQEIEELKQSVELLKQKNEALRLNQVQLEAQQQSVKEQRQLVLAQQSTTDSLSGNANELVASLAQVDELQSSLANSEIEKRNLLKRFQEQQALTEQLQSAYNESTVELKQARLDLADQEAKLTTLRGKVASAGSSGNDLAVQEVEDRLATAEREFEDYILAADASQRALAQESALLQVQINDAKARENTLQEELSRVVDELSGAEVDGALLEFKIKSQVELHRQQMQQLRQQLAMSAQELLQAQAKLEQAQSSIAGVGGQQSAFQNSLIDQRQASERKVADLENEVAKAQSRELMFRGELERLSAELANSAIDNSARELTLKNQIANQQSNLNGLQAELADSKVERERISEELELALGDVASSSVELNSVRDQLVTQRSFYEKQIAVAFNMEESLVAELQRLEDALAGEQLDVVSLERELNEQLETAKDQTEQFVNQLAFAEQEIDDLKSALQGSAGQYGQQSAELDQLQSLLEQQRNALSLQKDITKERENQLEGEIERLNSRTADAETRNAILAGKISEQNEKIAELTAKYTASTDALKRRDNGLGDQQALVAQLQQELQRVRFDSLSQISIARAELEENKEALNEAQALYGQYKAEADRLRAQQSSSSRDLEAQLASARLVEQSLKQQLEQTTEEADSLRQQLTEQEQQYKYELASARGQLLMAQDENSSSLLQLAELESQLAEKETLISEQESEINSLQTEVTRTKAAAAKNPGQFIQPTANVGPAIAIIEPEMLVTRGGPALKTPAGKSDTMDVIGTVRPSENILSFKIDGETVPLNDNGVFKYMMKSKERVLRMHAIDDTGGRTDLELSVTQTRGVSQEQANANAPDLSGIKFGDYHALIIGNNDFNNLQNLKTAETDAITVEKLLREKYGFKTKLLLNAKRYDILSALNEMRETLTNEDNLLIYYAGHGEVANETGYWLPVDAEPDNDANWIANATITKYVETMNAKHVIVIADSCYSGTLSRTSLARLSRGLTQQQKKKWYETIASSKVRTVFTSGGVKPVLDSVGGSRHSIFSAAFIDELETSASKVVSTYKLFLKVQERVKQEAARLGLEQNPQYSPMQFAGHESGEFLFLIDGKSDSAKLETETESLSIFNRKVALNTTIYDVTNH
ncbi:MAG: caspase family protein [Granulosicoccus sp.]